MESLHKWNGSLYASTWYCFSILLFYVLLGILCLYQGLGKRLQTISLLGYSYEFWGIKGLHMVVVPKSTLGNWMNGILHFCPIFQTVKFLGLKMKGYVFPERNYIPAIFCVSFSSLMIIWYRIGLWFFVNLQIHICENLLLPSKFDICVTSLKWRLKERLHSNISAGDTLL